MKTSEVKKILSLEAHIEIKEIRKRKEEKIEVNDIYIKSARKKVRAEYVINLVVKFMII